MTFRDDHISVIAFIVEDFKLNISTLTYAFKYQFMLQIAKQPADH